jgi:hypothetical protein
MVQNKIYIQSHMNHKISINRYGISSKILNLIVHFKQFRIYILIEIIILFNKCNSHKKISKFFLILTKILYEIIGNLKFRI